MKKIRRALFVSSFLIPVLVLAQPQLIVPLKYSGPQEGGSIFRGNLPGFTPGIIHTFNNLNPHMPRGGVCAGDDDWLYGAVVYNGTNNEGAAYRIRKDGTGFVKLFDFGSGSNARSSPFYHTDGKVYYNAENKIKVFNTATMGVTDVDPNGATYAKDLLIDADDFIYVVNFGYRLVKFRTDGSSWQELHVFDAPTEGQSGEAGLTEVPGDRIFGVQKFGGTNDVGTLFSINKDGTGFAVHHHFDNATGSYPESKLEYFDGKLYGTTTSGGNFSKGVLYVIDADGSNFRVLYHFEDASVGADPIGNIQVNNEGRIYGGYSQFHQNSFFQANRLWKIDTSGQNIEQFFSVDQRENGHWNYDIFLTNDTIFLTTGDQGRHEGGVLSRVDTFGFGLAIHQFGASANGFNPEGALIKGSDGRLYGSTKVGGPDGNGIVYSINQSGGSFLKLHEFTDAEGYSIFGKLMEGSDGKIYGACNLGGPTNTGCLFRMDKNGSNFQIIYNFSDLAQGHWPSGSLVEGPGGVLYGTFQQGNNGAGIFRINLNGSGYTVLKFFSTSEVFGPHDGVILYRGYLYGFLLNGGVEGRGGIYRIRITGTDYQVMHEFTNAEGAQTWAPPTAANNGRIYGTAQFGAANGYGSVFSIDSSGSGFTVHKSFDFVTDGGYPFGQLIQASDGLIYGTTASSNIIPGGGGTIFRLNPDGSNFTTVREFRSITEGYSPSSVMDLLAVPLPVQWIDFTAKQKEQSVLLEWQTAQEQNADQFIIERSNMNNAFTAIGAVTATGNTATGARYSFTDPNPFNGDNYYRLKQTDKDGNFAYSKTVRISFSGRETITLSPNPALDNLTIKLPASELVKAIIITDAAGRLVMSQGSSGSSTVTVRTQGLSKGMYYLQVETTQKIYRQAFLKQ